MQIKTINPYTTNIKELSTIFEQLVHRGDIALPLEDILNKITYGAFLNINTILKQTDEQDYPEKFFIQYYQYYTSQKLYTFKFALPLICHQELLTEIASKQYQINDKTRRSTAEVQQTTPGPEYTA